MKCYMFTREITRREAINKFGKLGYTMHQEAVIIPANSLEEAEKEIEPFNWKKHIKFQFEKEVDKTSRSDCYCILDLGIID